MARLGPAPQFSGYLSLDAGHTDRRTLGALSMPSCSPQSLRRRRASPKASRTSPPVR